MMWVNIYGDDTDFIVFWVIVIPYINSVSPAFVFHLCGPCLDGFLFGSFCLPEVLRQLMSQWPILPHDWHVESLAGQNTLSGT